MNQTGRLTAVLGVAASGVVMAAPSAFAADVTVRPADLTAHTSWLVSPNNTAVAGIGALADPIHFDGSAHLQVAEPTQRAQLALPLNDSLAGVAAKPLSYQVFVDPAESDPSVVPYGVSLQLQVSGPTFTTLSFQPQLEGGAVAGAWKTFANSENAAVWRTSRAFGSFAAGSDHSLADYISAEPASRVNAAFLNIGTGAAELNVYTDNVSVEGNTYNFATTGSAHASLTAPNIVHRDEPVPIGLDFTSPADGPKITDASAELTISGPDSLRGKGLTLEHGATALDLHQDGNGTFSAKFDLSGETLAPGTGLTADLSLLLHRHAPCGTYTVTGQLLSDGVATGLSASQTLTLECPTPPPTQTPTPPPTHPAPTTWPTWPGGGGGGGGLPPTGAFDTASLLWSSLAATGFGLLLARILRRRRAH